MTGQKSRTKQRLSWLIGSIVAYLFLLFILGFVLRPLIETKVKTSLGDLLRTDTVSIDNINISLLRGKLYLNGIEGQRDDIGTAHVSIGSIEVEFAALGLALFDREIDRIQVSDAHIQLSVVGAALMKRKKGNALIIKELIIKNSSITVIPTSLLPSLGKTKISVIHAETTDLFMDNSLSWLHRSKVLNAKLQTPGDLVLLLNYGDGDITIGGTMLGSRPITIPFAWPEPDPRKWELDQIVELGSQITKLVMAEVAKRKAKGVWNDLKKAL